MSAVKQANNPNGTWTQRAEQVRDQVAQAPEQLGECVQEHPMSSVLAAFGIGIVAGAGLVALYCAQSAPQTPTYDSLTQRMSDALRDVLPRNLFQS